MLTDVRLGSTYAYTYNNADRLKTVSYEGNLRRTYTYNGLEQLIVRVVTNLGTANGTTHYIHDRGGNIIAETNGTAATAAATLREYIWLPEAEIAPTVGSRTVVDMPVAVVDGVNLPTPATWMVHTDHLHRPIRMTDTAKAAVWQATWQPFGAPHQITGSAVLDARFPGQWFQLEAGLHYNWHRSYDASLGRYTQPDPLGFVDGPSVYGYARSSPGRYVDRDGLVAVPPQPPGSGSLRLLCKEVGVPGPSCKPCLAACDGGSGAIEQFCRNTAMDLRLKALCYAVIYVAKPVCKGYCYANHC